MPNLFSAKNLRKSYKVSNNPLKKGYLEVLQDVSFSLNEGQTLAVVGESGSGKSTLARILVGADSPDSGELLFEGKDILKRKNKFQWYKNIRMIFQDASASLNPRATIMQSLEEPLHNGTTYTASQRRERIKEVLEMVGLRAEYAERYPHTFSGGQRQRIAIARALLLRPKVIVADEPVSALDVSVQAQIINLLLDLQDQLDLAYVFISHDLGLVQHFSNKVLVLNNGKQEEYGRVADIFSQPKSQYTLELLNASAGYKKNR
ncbi:ABC transporter ATP-binding protein [Kangiella sediminilitoris]|uniref:ABC transporter ATP-binding protein n=1 Tax=Kangiella sediminilitoris TaxID=1144748 RepID=A0A1B3B968_9GAMM|nr:ATP-binding cassette domain-containing protein [Kangiella sediminilitoris]AOE49348.1 ABC transporter ATP-binding protein [Kangiella sediminilitoris]